MMSLDIIIFVEKLDNFDRKVDETTNENGSKKTNENTNKKADQTTNKMANEFWDKVFGIYGEVVKTKYKIVEKKIKPVAMQLS